VTRSESVLTFALKRARQVDAVTVLANAVRPTDRTLVDVPALVGARLCVSLGTDARERTNQILARELAVVGGRRALVHVFAAKRLKSNRNVSKRLLAFRTVFLRRGLRGNVEV